MITIKILIAWKQQKKQHFTRNTLYQYSDGYWRQMPYKKPIQVIRAHRWHWHRLGHLLWSKIMNYNPQNPHWPNRDRFILSAGHACMLQYSFLYLTGYDLTLNDIKKFRQLHSKTPGHPEYGLLDGIEATTGPLGQGFANGVGMGIAQKWLADRYNKPGFKLFDYNIYVICSDGDMMEGISSEAASVAGNLQLGNLIYIYDDNHITIEGNTRYHI